MGGSRKADLHFSWRELTLETTGSTQAETITPEEIAATEEVGAGDEIIVISMGCLNSPGYFMCGILAHEGKRCVNSYSVSPEDVWTPAEGKEHWSNEVDTYSVNVASMDGAIFGLENISDSMDPGPGRDKVDDHLDRLADRREIMKGRLDDALATLAALCS